MKIKQLPVISSLLFMVMLLLVWLGYQLVTQAPAIKVLESVRLSPPVDSATPLILGWEALGQVSQAGLVEKQHLQARFVPNEGWQLANIAAHRKVAVTGKTGEKYELRRMALQLGDVIQLGKQSLAVRGVSPYLLLEHLSSENAPPAPIIWNGNSVQAGTPNYTGCPNAWRQAAYLPESIRRYLSTKTLWLGGAVQCHDRLALPGVPFHAASITQTGDAYYLHLLPSNASVLLRRGDKELVAANFETPVVDVSSIIIGRTKYFIQQQGECKPDCDLLLSAEAGSFRPVFAADVKPPALPPNMTVFWTDPQWIGGLGGVQLPNVQQVSILLVFVLVMWLAARALLVWRVDLLNERKRVFLWVSLGLPVLVFWLGAVWLDGWLAWQLVLAWLSWGMASVVLHRNGLMQGDVGKFWLVLVLLAGLGALVQVQLAAGADSTRYLRFPAAHLQFLLIVPVLICVLALTPVSLLQRAWGAMQQSRLRWWLLGSLLLVLLLQTGLGDETGFGAVQPVELAKTVLVLLLAGFVLNWQELHSLNARGFRENRGVWLGHFLKALLLGLVVVMGVAVGVSDFSPILIVGGTLLAYGWLLMHWRGKIVLLAMLGGVLLGGLWVQQHPAWIDAGLWWFPQSDRLHIWAQPWQYPDTGYQLQRALQAIHHDGQVGGEQVGLVSMMRGLWRFQRYKMTLSSPFSCIKRVGYGVWDYCFCN